MSEATVPANAHESRDPVAARALALLMSETSEDCMCAGWLIDCEHTLWRMLSEPNETHEWGLSEVVPDILQALQRLSEKCGGWIRWRDVAKGEWFVPLDDWLERHAAYERKLAAWAAEDAASETRRLARSTQ